MSTDAYYNDMDNPVFYSDRDIEKLPLIASVLVDDRCRKGISIPHTVLRLLYL